MESLEKKKLVLTLNLEDVNNIFKYYFKKQDSINEIQSFGDSIFQMIKN